MLEVCLAERDGHQSYRKFQASPQPLAPPLSLIKKANKTHHHDAVCDGQPKTIFVDTSSGCPSGSTTAMMGHSYPQHELPMLLRAPRSEFVARSLACSAEGRVGVLRAAAVVDQGKSGRVNENAIPKLTLKTPQAQ
ncbi:hypothetical protein EDD85DRAFT_941592 [Armillaria nabsnona]|nr:hypothetical protein EDD85DRAFT_941592 [Armillaria nabsnona]